jgi:hypothetical protein
MLTPSAAPIVAEIAQRLCELDEQDHASSHDLIRRLAAIGDLTPRLYRSVLAALHGDTLAVVESYAVQADRRGLTKQAIHVEWHNDIQTLAKYYPELAAALKTMRDTAELNSLLPTHTKPDSHNDQG